MVKMPRLLPREEKFFDMFEDQARLAVASAKELTLLVKNLPDAAHYARNIKTYEHEADALTRAIISSLNRSFITPIDRGDIHALACGLDEVIDYIEVAGHKISLYRFDALRPEVITVAELILAATLEVQKAVKCLRKFPDAEGPLREINRLEAEADHICRVALADVLNSEADAVAVIKWKEIFEVMEGATDRCEDVADIVDGVIVKNA